MTFTSFSTDGLIGLPPELFSTVIPAITLPSELKVTLHMFYRLSQQRTVPRRLSWDDLASDRLLSRSLRAISKVRPVTELLDEGLDAAVRRATVLHVALPGNGRLVNWYLMHTAFNRAWVEQARQHQPVLEPGIPTSEQRPSLITLYEQNIGLVTPLLVDELREAEERYPPDWIEAAIREAVQANVRSWRYVRKVLERWATHGKQNASNRFKRPVDIEKYTRGRFGALFRLGSDESDLERSEL